MNPSGTSAAGPSAEPTSTRGAAHPGWASVGEALATRSWAVVEHCRVVGRDLAERGVSAREALGELRSTTRQVVAREPRFEECEALVDAWADATLGYLNRLSCADQQYVRSRAGNGIALPIPLVGAREPVEIAERGVGPGGDERLALVERGLAPDDPAGGRPQLPQRLPGRDPPLREVTADDPQRSTTARDRGRECLPYRLPPGVRCTPGGGGLCTRGRPQRSLLGSWVFSAL